MDLKIGILCDNFKFKRWQQEIIDQIFLTSGLKLSLLILNEQKTSNSTVNKLGYRALTYFDRKIFNVNHDAFKIIDIEETLKEIPVLKVEPKPLKFGVKFSSEDVSKVESYGLDVLIRFGFGIIKGDVLNAARFGVWSLHHGDNKVNRGGPPGFWEVVNSEAITGITLQKLSADLDGGKVIGKSFVKTDSTSFYRNQNSAFWAGVELMSSSLKDLKEERFFYSEKLNSQDSIFYSYPLYKDPGNLKSAKIFFSFWKRRLKEVFKEEFAIPSWSLAYKFSSNKRIEASIFRYKNLLPPKGYEWADPFVVFENENYYVFIEELERKKKKAHLSYLKFDSQGSLLTPTAIKIIQENFHLSYPFTFKEAGQYYMIPEMADSHEVWIYKASSFPDKWEKFHLLFEDKQLFDPSLYYHNDIWYLFGTEKTNIGSSRDQFLCLYYSEDLFSSKWAPHPLNPITRDVRGARPAGKIFNWNDRLIRPGQIGAPNYGYGIQFYEILKLSQTEYEECPIDVLVPEWTKNIKAVHTINFERGFSVIDKQGKI